MVARAACNPLVRSFVKAPGSAFRVTRPRFRSQNPMLTPPSTGITAPVMNFAAGDVR